MRRPAVLLALGLSLACSSPALATPSPHIVGGVLAAADAYPAQAQVSTATGPSSAALCGGTLVAPQWVLTAAHCVSDETTDALAAASSITVRLGSVRLFGGAPSVVDAVERSPDWNGARLTSDAALLHLAAPAAVAPVALGGAAEGAARVVGWGQTAVRSAASSVLRQADVSIVADGVCGSRSVYGGAFDPASMLCAGGGGADACFGDSGGPLLVGGDGAWRQVGIVSWGEGCGTAGYPGVYTDLAEPRLRAWIAGTLAGSPVSLPVAAAPPAAAPAPATPIAATPAATPAVGSITLPRTCARWRCRVALHFPAAGLAHVRLLLPRSSVAVRQLAARAGRTSAADVRAGRARRGGRTVTLASRRIVAETPGARRVTVSLPAAARRAIRRAGVRRLRVRLDAELFVAGASVVRLRDSAMLRR